MATPRHQTLSEPAERDDDARDGVAEGEMSIWDGLSDEDRASIERGLAQSLTGIHSTDEEVEAAFATFGR